MTPDGECLEKCVVTYVPLTSAYGFVHASTAAADLCATADHTGMLVIVTITIVAYTQVLPRTMAQPAAFLWVVPK